MKNEKEENERNLFLTKAVGSINFLKQWLHFVVQADLRHGHFFVSVQA